MNDLLIRLKSAWDNLSSRERALVGAMGAVFAVVVIVFAVVNPLLGLVEDAQLRVDTAEQRVRAMERLRREFDEVNGELAAVEQRIRNNRERRNILTMLEAMAEQAQVKIDSVEQRQAADSELYKETRVEVTLRSVSLDQLVGYLENIETAERRFSVKSLRVKTRSDKPELLDADFMVSSFEPI